MRDIVGTAKELLSEDWAREGRGEGAEYETIVAVLTVNALFPRVECLKLWDYLP